MRLYIGLVHYPVYDKHEKRIASSITNTDLHDIARLARTYAAGRFFVITPLEDQTDLALRIIRHWTAGYGASYNRYRKEAMEMIEVVPDLASAVDRVKDMEGGTPLVVATDASRRRARTLGYGSAAEMLHRGRVILLIFGTAWGLSDELIEGADYLLEPVEGPSDYNHLSVRSAAAIILDRLAGQNRPVGV